VRCPFCNAEESRVVDSRPADGGSAIRRRRECTTCENRFTTYERIEPALLVRKRDGRIEPFDTTKIRSGVAKAVADRDVAASSVDRLVASLERYAEEHGPEVGSDDLGRLVLEGLREVDQVSYLRFASVYKEFEGAQDFEREVAALDESS
jgi:transcriptional repressor NrdR